MLRQTIQWVLFLATVNLSMNCFAAVMPIKGYREWKTDKILAATTQTNVTRALLVKAKTEGQKSNAETLDRELTQLQWNLDAAKDLSVTDYFVLYLSQQTAADRFQQAAPKLNTVEIAELMEAYANTLGRTSPIEAVSLRSSPTSSRHKLPVQATQSRDSLK